MFRFRAFAVSVLMLAAVPLAAADFAAGAGTVEASGYTGVFIGPPGVGNHPLLGGGFYAYVNRHVSVGIDAEYAPISHENILGLHTDSNLYAVLSGVRVHLPNRSRVHPYFVGSLGLARTTASVRFGGMERVSASVNELAYGGGAGANTAVTRNFGIRLEARYLRDRQGSNTGQVLAGVYYRFGNR